MVRSLLGDLIARTKQEDAAKQPPSSLSDNAVERRPQGPTRRTSSHQERRILRTGNKGYSKEEDDTDRKNRAKRKHQVVNFDTEDDADDDDDDSLYRDDEKEDDRKHVKEEEKSQEDNSVDSQNLLQQHHEDYSAAFSAIYGPPTVPVAATVSEAYLSTLQEVMVPNQNIPPVLNYSTPDERKQPRFLRKRNRKTKAWETHQETPEQALDRFHRQERANERITIEARWKSRPFDLRQEEDVGGAIYRRAKRQLKEKVMREVKEKRIKEGFEAARKAQEIANAKASKDDEDSVQEQQDVLDRLTQSSMDATSTTRTLRTSGEYTSGDDMEDVWTNDDTTVSYRDSMDYWEYGLSVPREQDLEFQYNLPDLKPQLRSGEVLRDPDAHDKGLRLSAGQLRFMQSDGHDQRNWRPAYLNSNMPQCPRFFHYRKLQNLAVRHLCGGSLGENTRQEDHSLRLLFSPVLHDQRITLAQFSNARTLLRLSHQLGCNALLFAKNVWSNPIETARELCLLPQSALESHLLAGRSMEPNAIKLFMNNRRLAVLRKYRIKSRPWRHTRKEMEASVKEDAEKDVPAETAATRATEDSVEAMLVAATPVTELKDEGTMEDLGKAGVQVTQGKDPITDSDAIRINTDMGQKNDSESVGEGTTVGGVIIDLQTVESKSAIEHSNICDSPYGSSTNDHTILFPSATFSHIQGTSPTVPQFPLDALAVVFGPPDRHARYHHQDNLVHHHHFQLALSTLLSRAMVIDSDHGSDKLHRQIHTLLEQYIDVADTKGYRRQLLFTRGNTRDMPCVQLFRAIQCYCSFWANGCPRSASLQWLEAKEEVGNGEDALKNDGGDLYGMQHRGPFPIQDLAERMYVFLDKYIQHNGLVRFARPRVIYALTYICHKIPEGAAKILAKPLDDHECPTPLHVLRRVVEYLETNNLILGGKVDRSAAINETGAMRDGELEYIFFEAARKLEEATKASPMNIECHLWRIGMLASCLLLSAGNRIGSGAHRYPSRATRKVYETAGSDPDALDHEIREELPKYEEIAVQLSSAVSALFSLARHHPGEYAHRAVTSFLEWNQVVALLAGGGLEQSIDDITSVHAYHAFLGYLADDSENSQRSAMPYSRSVAFCASELERDPSDIKRWRSLVDVLGPVGIVCKRDDSNRDAHASTCLHCKFTRMPRIFDHDRRDEAGPRWWGRNREWWLSSILKVESTLTRNGPIVGEVVRGLAASNHAAFQAALTTDTCSPVMPCEGAYFGWLPTRERLRQQRQMPSNRVERRISFDKRLPAQACLPVSNADNEHLMSSLLRVNVPKVEIVCYKILLCCHLVGPGHRDVEKSLSELLLRVRSHSTGNQSSPDEWHALEWLYQNASLDIPNLAEYYYGESLNRPVKKPGRTRVVSTKLVTSS